jgi:hypothetical protein
MPNKNKTIVFDNNLEFVGAYSSWSEAASDIFNDKDYINKIARYIQGKINDLDGYVALPFQGYLTAARISEYKKAAKSRMLLANIFKIDSSLIAKLSEEDAQAIDEIIKKYI